MKLVRNQSWVLLAGSLVTAWGCVAWAQQGPLDTAGRAVKRGFQSAGQAIQGSFNSAQTSVHNMEVVSRVYSRLHWDKALTTSNIEIDVTNGGIATVTGVVPDEPAKTKALTLTSETVGVIQVVDQIVVTPPVPPLRPGAAPIVPGVAPTVIKPAVVTPGVVTPAVVTPGTNRPF